MRLLTIEEVKNTAYGFTNDGNSNTARAASSWWWLRSPGYSDDFAADVYGDGSVTLLGYFVYIEVGSVRPAFNLNLSSVLFSSASSADKSSFASVGTDKVSTNTWKLTLKDVSKTVSVTSGQSVSQQGQTVTVPYTYTGSDVSQISIMITDKAYTESDASILYYGALDTALAATGTGIFTLPEGLPDGYKIYMMAEDVNNENLTDYSSTPVEIVLPTTSDVTITNPTNSHITLSTAPGNGGETQTGLTGAMTSVVYTADDGYYFPTDYSVTAVNGIGVTRNSYSQITVSGTPIATAAIMLTAATEKGNQNAPTGLSDGVDKIAGTTMAMEYASSASAVSWNACSDGNTTAAAGTWYVRLKETDTKKASTATSITVTASSTLYQVTVNNGTGDGNYAKDATVTITADAASSGQHFKEWTVVSGGVTLTSSTSASTTFTMPANAVEVTAAYENDTPAPTAPTYKIMEGADATWTTGSDGTLSIRGDGAYSKFKEVKVDGTAVASSNYSVTEGSTIITFKADYLKTLSVGKHTIELVWTDGSATTSFAIKEAAANSPSHKDDVPKTGDSTPIAWLFILALISGTGILYFGRKKKQLNNFK